MSSAHTRFSKWLVSGAGLIVAAAAVAVPQAAHAAGSTVSLPDVLPGITLATLDGPAPANQTMRLDIALNHPNVAGEQAAYSALYNPSSPTYHQFLTPAQYDASFGVSQATATAVSTWLSGGGLDVFYQAPSHDLFEVSGTVAQIDALFQTTVNRYNAGSIGFLANPQEPAVSGRTSNQERDRPQHAPALPHHHRPGDRAPRGGDHACHRLEPVRPGRGRHLHRRLPAAGPLEGL